MKRNEAVKELAIWLLENQGENTPEEFADKFLNKCENLGMLPPTITIMKNTYNRTDGTYGFDANEWEPEDEA